MKTQRALALAVLALMMAGTSMAQTRHELFQRALHLETSRHTIDAAIALYDRIETTCGKDRALGAHALFRMGQIYEALGRTESVNTYRRIIRDYSDQTDTAGMARIRLAKLVKAGSPGTGVQPKSRTASTWMSAVRRMLEHCRLVLEALSGG